MQPELTSFETLLNSILDVLQYPEFKSLEISDREAKVRELLENSQGLLYVDNLERQWTILGSSSSRQSASRNSRARYFKKDGGTRRRVPYYCRPAER